SDRRRRTANGLCRNRGAQRGWRVGGRAGRIWRSSSSSKLPAFGEGQDCAAQVQIFFRIIENNMHYAVAHRRAFERDYSTDLKRLLGRSFQEHLRLVLG